MTTARRLPFWVLRATLLVVPFSWPAWANEKDSLAANAKDVREFEVNGTRLYVPIGWQVQIFEEAQKRVPLYLKSGEPIPPEYGPPPVKLNFLQTTFCHPVDVTETHVKAGESRRFELKRVFDTPEIPQDWCIGRMSLSWGQKDIVRNPKLGPLLVSNEYQEKYLGPIDKWDFRVRSHNSETNEGTYFGFRPGDISIAGGPIAISCNRDLNPMSLFFTCETGGDAQKFSSPALEGVRAHSFDWYVEAILPAKLRRIYWNSQSFLDWLNSPPGIRSKQIKEHPHAISE